MQCALHDALRDDSGNWLGSCGKTAGPPQIYLLLGVRDNFVPRESEILMLSCQYGMA